MPFIDTHAHVYLEEFDADRSLVLERAEKEGVNKVLLPAVDSSTHLAMLSAEEDFSGLCYSMMGVHPCSVKGNFKEELELARDYLEKRRFLAVGEIGLDFYWDLTYKEQQYESFNRQIEWALHYDIPIVIHSRNSIDECIQVVSDHQKGKLKGIFHCFSGNLVQAGQIIDLGFYLGIGGVLTFKNSGLDKVMQELNLDQVMLETDSPYLAPVPFRGKRNECGYIKHVAKKLAEIKKLTVEEVGEVTTKNAVKLFGELL
jgi:TatD DNase family protein